MILYCYPDGSLGFGPFIPEHCRGIGKGDVVFVTKAIAFSALSRDGSGARLLPFGPDRVSLEDRLEHFTKMVDPKGKHSAMLMESEKALANGLASKVSANMKSKSDDSFGWPRGCEFDSVEDVLEECVKLKARLEDQISLYQVRRDQLNAKENTVDAMQRTYKKRLEAISEEREQTYSGEDVGAYA